MTIGELLRRLDANYGDDSMNQEMAARLIERMQGLLRRAHYEGGDHIFGEELSEAMKAVIDNGTELPDP